MSALRALTLWPEWAWAIHHLDKRVENRTWCIPKGEWFALHAGKHVGGRPGCWFDGTQSLISMAARAGWLWADSGDVVSFCRSSGEPAVDTESLTTSAILGLFRVTRHDQPGRGDLDGWRVPDLVGNVFEYRPLPTPVPCKGAQGLWTVPADVAGVVLDGPEWARGEGS